MLMLIMDRDHVEWVLQNTDTERDNFELIFSPLDYLCDLTLSEAGITVKYPVRFYPGVSVDAASIKTYARYLLEELPEDASEVRFLDPTPVVVDDKTICAGEEENDQLVVLRLYNPDPAITMTVETDGQLFEWAKQNEELAQGEILRTTYQFYQSWLENCIERDRGCVEGFRRQQKFAQYEAVAKAKALGLPANFAAKKLKSDYFQTQTWVVRPDGSLRKADETYDPAEDKYYALHGVTEIWHQILEGELVLAYDLDLTEARGENAICTIEVLPEAGINLAQEARVSKLEDKLRGRINRLSEGLNLADQYDLTWSQLWSN